MVTTIKPLEIEDAPILETETELNPIATVICCPMCDRTRTKSNLPPGTTHPTAGIVEVIFRLCSSCELVTSLLLHQIKLF